MKKTRQAAPVIAILNMKGGVGKTTVSAHVFRVFYEQFKASTLLVDMDPQFNLTQTLFTRSQYERLKTQGKTVMATMEPLPTVDLFTVKTSASPPPDPSDIRHRLRKFNNNSAFLDIIPGDFNLVKYSLMDDNKKLTSVKKRYLKFIDNARDEYKVVCLDCNPSSSFLTLCALQACTHIIVPVRPDKYSILGLEMLSEFVNNIPSINPKPKFIVLINGIPRTNYNRAVENELRAHSVFGTKTLVHGIHHSNILLAHPDYTGFATDKGVPYKTMLKAEITAVAGEIAPLIGFTS